MVTITTYFTAFCVAAGVAIAVPIKDGTLDIEARQAGQSFSQTYWENDYANVNYTSGAAGRYTLDWDNGFGGDFVIGKGYSPARDMLVNYTGIFELDRNTNAYLALYGWTINPLVEYYVVENMGVHNPSDNASATLFGYLDSDGGTYEIWSKIRTNAPSIQGTATYPQFWSIRTKSHTGGTINTGNHFRAWESVGLHLGSQTSFNIAIEGQDGGGHADITVGVLPSTFPQETPTSTRRTAPPHYSTHYTKPASTSSRSSSRPTSAPAPITSSQSSSRPTSAHALTTSSQSSPRSTSVPAPTTMI